MFCVVQNGIDEPSLHELTSNEGGNIEREKGRLFFASISIKRVTHNG